MNRPGDAYDEAVAAYGREDHARIAGPWFDQFGPAPAGWVHDQWCWRHWAACPQLGANGVAAMLEVTRRFIAAHPDLGALELNAEMARTGRLCCALGDEAMYGIWGKCGPESGPGAS